MRKFSQLHFVLLFVPTRGQISLSIVNWAALSHLLPWKVHKRISLQASFIHYFNLKSKTRYWLPILFFSLSTQVMYQFDHTLFNLTQLILHYHNLTITYYHGQNLQLVKKLLLTVQIG